MNTSNTLRVFVILEWILIIGAISCSASLESSLPQDLKNWLASEEAEGSAIVAFSFIPALIGALVGSIGLLFLKRWAAWLYLVCTIILAVPDGQPLVEDSITASVGEISLLISGIIIGMSFFSSALVEGVTRHTSSKNGA